MRLPGFFHVKYTFFRDSTNIRLPNTALCGYDTGRKGETSMYSIDKKQFGAFVARLRKEKGYTQKELAARLFVSDKAVSKWETGVSQS